MRDVRRAGETIAEHLVWTAETEAGIREAFSVANGWRDAHAHPMRSIRLSLLHFIRHRGLHGFAAARLKRMPAIRRKLSKMKARGRTMHLNQLQDLGGCRAIMDSMDDVRGLVAALQERVRHEVRGVDDYIASPKSDGYRSVHLKLAFRGKGVSTVFDGRRIEVQVRTILQHAWATAVEAVGMIRGEDLKGSDGDDRWLRLFRLVSAEFAVAEKCPVDPKLPDRSERQREIHQLVADLDALTVLERLSTATDWHKRAVQPRIRPTHYLIEYDLDTRTVSVHTYSKPALAAAGYDQAEAPDLEAGTERKNRVLVEVDKLENLERAYPNYFGDVQLFRRQLSLIAIGKNVEDFVLIPQPIAGTKSRESPIAPWMGRRGMWTEPKRRPR